MAKILSAKESSSEESGPVMAVRELSQIWSHFEIDHYVSAYKNHCPVHDNFSR